MKETQTIKVAAPWGLSHYIPLNGFHPLYRALFDQAPQNIIINSTDNVKINKELIKDPACFNDFFKLVKQDKIKLKNQKLNSIGRAHQEFFWSPNRVATEAISGDIEFHHTAPFPSMTRPFVFHCESFAPVLFPLAEQGDNKFIKKIKEIRDYYSSIFKHKYCLGIFSHIPETIESFKLFFNDPEIEKKLFHSKIGLSRYHFDGVTAEQKSSVSKPTFLFINSANQNPGNFTKRGGHLVLRFWKEFKNSGRDGLLIFRCSRPDRSELERLGVDMDFVESEIGKSIIWSEVYLNNYEINKLVAKANFFLLPSASLHSVSIMQAMKLGTVPVVTDALGVDTYVTKDKDGIVLKGMKAAIWKKDPVTGLLIDDYSKIHNIDNDLLIQMTEEIFKVLDNTDLYNKLSRNAVETAAAKFSGEAFSTEFWGKLSELYAAGKDIEKSDTCLDRKKIFDRYLMDQQSFKRAFTSPTQPMRRLYTGQNLVAEMTGAFIQMFGTPKMNLNDWSVFAAPSGSGGPSLCYENTLNDLKGAYIYRQDLGSLENNVVVKILKFYIRNDKTLSFLLKLAGLPRLQASRIINYLRFTYGNNGMAADVELSGEGIRGFNIIRYFFKYYAIPQSEGGFFLERIKNNEYSRSFSGITYLTTVAKVKRNVSLEEAAMLEAPNEVHPKLVFENFHGFNIIEFNGSFYGISQLDGAFDLEKIENDGYRTSFTGSTLLEVKKSINSYKKQK
ncbi:hypothetical protein P0136_00165 [Lentisphaerota bacterium ZTH]|nr:hypothetical protein JYG24_08690 [Lentisphaerota bacterium]WET06430.1 hypothetical protein P0136_00165 [Lentisphaerota bacterium ZTH]